MQAEAEVLYCENHPTTETSLRCNRCEKLICAKCAMRTPTGYRCPECVKSQRKAFDTAGATDYLVGMAIAGVLSLIGALIAQILGFFVIFLAPFAGVLISNVIQNALKGRRAKRLFQLIALSVAIGAMLPMSLILLGLILALVSGGGGIGGALLGLLWPTIYAVLTTSTVYYRLSGIRL